MDEKKIKFNWKYFLWIALAVFLLRLPTFYQHIIDIDETVFSEFAKVILSGGLPYVDVVDNKPPLTYFFFAVVYFLTGSYSLIAVHIVTAIWVFVTALFVFFTAKKFAPEKAAFAGTIAFILLMHTYEPKYISTNGETLINLPLIASCYLFLFYGTNFRGIILHVISGFLLGLAILTNYKSAVVAILYVIYTLIAIFFFYKGEGVKIKQLLIKLFITGVASFVPIIAMSLFFYKKGIFDDALFWGFLYNFGYIESGTASGSVSKIFFRSIYFVLLGFPVWLCIATGFLKEFIKSSRWKEIERERMELFVFFICWLLLSFYAATLGGRGYGHYFIQIVPPLSLLGAFFYEHFAFKKFFWLWIALPVFILTLSRVDMLKSYELINYPNYRSEISYKRVGEFIKNNSSFNDKIYVWGWATPVYYFADRRPASRFIISDFVSGRVFGTDNKSDAKRKNFAGKFLPILCDDLRKNKPKFIADTSPSGYFGYDRFPISEFIELDEFIKKNYEKFAEIDKIVIYKLK
ncbi:MAG: hypothetical protein BWY23_01012 [Spirochaetes bacterium ADurb.Bin218]|nr:MAG: hypothetical protein BWY23_01012 [Spirochaetes bacterium ADurb.Bin218]